MKSDDKSFLDINEHELDKEWIEQPRLYHKYARKLADARLAFDEAKANLDLVSADLDNKIRESPEDYDLEKVTEPGIKNCVLLQDEYREAIQALNDARHEVNVLEAAVSALDHRKRALEKLVDLFAMDYFAEPKTPKTSRAKEYVEDKKRSMR